MTARPADDRGDIVLDVRDLHTHFTVGGGVLSGGGDVVRAVDGVTFDVRRGEIFGLVGESGSGKTTLGRTILGLAPATSGSILYGDQDLATLPEKQFRPLRRKLSMIFQDPNASLNPAMTVGQGVGHPLRIHGITSDRASTRAKAAEMLERCGLVPAGRFLDQYPEDLSGGQKQRVVIARALVTEPDLVVADEPVAALDMSIRAKVLELMMDLKDELGLTYLYITHDLSSGKFVCDRMAIMYLGQMVEWGEADGIYEDPQHPYTRALLDAIPLPDPSRKGRDRQLPRGEIPDAVAPPAGCRFHPRCPASFEPCGWEGRDLVDAIEERWTTVDEDTFERELALVGDLGNAVVGRDQIRFPAADAPALRSWLEDVGERLPVPVAGGIDTVEEDAGDVVVRFRWGPEPGQQDVAGRRVACHLHGIVVRPDGDHVGSPPDDRAR
ncbi:MAG: ABC transporter ATP-binding protein [Actinobacteria bacterium]|nr:ABC transporter ATP-binding protein [Actinomycetota bacterium]